MTSTQKKITRTARIAWVPITMMRVVTAGGQRSHDHNWSKKLAEDFDFEAMGRPVVSLRGGYYWIIDGQHRIEALKLIGYGDQQVQCDVYENLTEEEEAEKFLEENNFKAVSIYTKFRAAVKAGRAEETAIDTLVRSLGLRITQSPDARGGIKAVGTLRRVYRRGVLPKTLRIIRDGFGDAGLEQDVMDGISQVCQRYGDSFDEVEAIKTFIGLHASLTGLRNRAFKIREQSGIPPGQAVAAAAVEFYNRTQKGKAKLDQWF